MFDSILLIENEYTLNLTTLIDANSTTISLYRSNTNIIKASHFYIIKSIYLKDPSTTITKTGCFSYK